MCHDLELPGRIIMQVCVYRQNYCIIKSENLRVPTQCRNPLSDILERQKFRFCCNIFKDKKFWKGNLSHYWAILMIRKWFLTLRWNFPPCNYHLLFQFCFPQPHNYVYSSGTSSTFWEKLFWDYLRSYFFMLNITSSLTPSTYKMVLELVLAWWLTLLWMTSNL